MKNLKKILMALLLVALMVSAVATVAIAEASYTGSVAEAQVLLNEAIAASGDVTKVKTEPLKKLYEYLLTVNPADEGYNEVKESYNQMTFKVAHKIHEAVEIKKCETVEDKQAIAKAITNVHLHIATAPVIRLGSEDVVFSEGFECKTCGRYRDFDDAEYYNGITDATACPGTCAKEEQELAYATDADKTTSYAKFEKDLNAETLAFAADVTAYLFGLTNDKLSVKIGEESVTVASYYEVRKARQAVLDYLAEVKREEYEAPTSTVYTGDVTVAMGIIEGIGEDTSFDEMKAVLAEAYEYLVANPVNPMVDGFASFLAEYNELGALLVKKLGDEVDACDNVDGKIDIISDFRDYLNGTEDKEGTQISEKVVRLFNEYRAAFIKTYRDAESVVSGLKPLEVRVPEAVAYNSDFTAFNEKLAAIEAAEAVTAEDVAALYAFVSTGIFDPTAEAYASTIERYVTICESYVKAEYVDEYNAAETLDEKNDVLSDFLEFIKATPLCEAVTDAYTELLFDMIGRAKAVAEAVDLGKLPVYEEAKTEITSVGAVLAALLGDVDSALSAYEDSEAAADVKAAALENAKAALVALGVYIEGNGIDTAENSAFVTNYNTTRQKIAAVLFDAVRAAEEGKTEEALLGVRAYFANAPVLTASVKEYNELVAELIADEAKAEELSLNNVYTEAFALIDEITKEDAAFKSMLENAKKLAECEKQYVDVTDAVYNDYKTARDGAYEKLAANIKIVLPSELETAAAEECVAIIEGYLAYADGLNVSIIINAVNETLTTEKEENDELVAKLEADPYRTECEKFLAEIEEFDAAETLEGKKDAFETIFKKYNGSDFMTTELMLDESFETIKSEYARVCAELEEAMLAEVARFTDPNKLIEALEVVHAYVTVVPFSQTVIDAYKAECEALMAIDFGESADKLIASCDEAEYVTPDDFSGYLARVNLALDTAMKENGVDKEAFKVVYNILYGFVGVDGSDNYAPKAIDFGVEALSATLESLEKIKTIYTKAIETAFADGNLTIDEKNNTLKDLGEFVKAYPYSKELHEFYYDSTENFSKNYRETAKKNVDAFVPLVDLLHGFLESCPVNTNILGTVEKSRYQTICTLADVSQLIVVEETIDRFWELPDLGDKSLIHENLAYDDINGYVESYGLVDTSDSKIAAAVVKFAFEEYLIKFAEQIKNSDEETKMREIAYVGRKIVSEKFPTELVLLYKNAFDLDDLKASPYAGDKEDTGILDVLAKAENEIDVANDASTVIEKLAEVVETVNTSALSNEGLLSEIQASADAIKADLDSKTAAQIELLETKSKIEEQNNPVFYNYDHESSVGFTNKKPSGSGNPLYHLIDDGTNKYAQMTRHKTDSNCFQALTISNLPQGVVVDFDLMSPGNLSFNIYENNINEYLFTFQDGVLVSYYSNYTKDDTPIVATPGQWIHVTVAVDSDAQTLEMFVDYVSLGTKQLKNTNRYKSLRMTCGIETGADASVNCYDNLKVYSGTVYRTLGKVMTTEEQFNNSVLAMLDTGLSKVDRARAYYTAYSLYDIVGAGCEESKAEFDAFDAETLKKEGSLEAVAAIVELEKQLDIAGMTTADVATAEQTVAKITSQIELNRQVINPTDENILRINKELIEVGEKIQWLSNLSIAVDHLGRFHRATTLASVTKHYNLFKTYYDICELEKADNMEAASNDPVCNKFVSSIAGDATVLEVLDEVTFDGYCHVYIPARMSVHNDKNNSVKIIDCIGFIKTLVADEATFESTEAYYEELIKQAENNYDYVETYLSIIRGLIKSEAYVADEEQYPGISKAVEIFFKLDEKFSEILKKAHYGIIEEKLARYNVTSSYIEKAGICTFLENFILENNVDLSDEQGVHYRSIIDVCNAELSVYMEDYESVLVANTEAFIATVEKMKTYVTYKELKPLYDEAMNQYYYSMNVDSDEARAAVETFTKYQEMILDWEESSAMFIGYVSNLKSARRQAQKFRALVNCMNCIDGISEDVSGVTAALKTYNEGLAAYNEDIAPTNSEIAEVTDAVCSLRTHSVAATILAIIRNMMNK